MGLFRGGAEEKSDNFEMMIIILEAVVRLLPSFFGTAYLRLISFIFNKAKKNENTLFIDASKHMKNAKQNKLRTEISKRLWMLTVNFRNIEKYSSRRSVPKYRKTTIILNIPRM